MFRIYWPQAKLRELISPAETNGETRITFPTISEAERFRFACYHYTRRRKGAAAHLSNLSFILNRSDCSILVKKVPEIRVKVNSNSNSNAGANPQ